MSELHDERAELAEDEEKLQIALQEYNTGWLTEGEDDEDEEDCLLIDLDKPLSTTEGSEGRSSSPTLTGSGSHIISLNAEESQDLPSAPDLPSVSSKDGEGSNSEKTLALNRALQGILEKHMEDIRVTLEENKIKQQRLEEGSWTQEAMTIGKGRTFGPFRSPYFQQGISTPKPNEDVILKKRSGEISFDDMHERLSLTVRNREALMEGVLEDLREQAMKPYMTKFEAEVKKMREMTTAVEEAEASLQMAESKLEVQQAKLQAQTSAKVERHAKAAKKKLTEELKQLRQTLKDRRREKSEQEEILEALEGEMGKIKALGRDVLLRGFHMDAVDWMRVAKRNFEDRSSWLDCRKAWERAMDPGLNRGSWSKEEDCRLVELVRANPSGGWDVVAEKLGTKRTAFMCFHRYQRCINPIFKPRPWTPEEDQHLLAVAKLLRESGGYFTWRKVSALVESRSAAECAYRHTKLDGTLSHGRWTKAEDARLLAAVEILGKGWSKVARYLGHRSATQCRDRYIQSLDPGLNFTFFTYEDDQKILRLRREGVSWSKMATHFLGRTDNMLLGRYRTLCNWRKERAWWDKQSGGADRLPGQPMITRSRDLAHKSLCPSNTQPTAKPEVQELLQGKHLSRSDRKTREGECSSYFNLRLGIGVEDYERQSKDREDGIAEDLIPPRPPVHLKYNRFNRTRRKLNAQMWTERLTFHSRLKENLSQLMAKEARSGKGVRLGIKDAPRDEGEETEDEERQSIRNLINTTANRTLEGRGHKKRIVQEMMSALNKYFLNDSEVKVKDLLDLAKTKRPARGPSKKNAITGSRINAELNKILRNNNKALVVKGRMRKTLPRDGRTREKIESEAEEVKSLAPILLIEQLAPGFSHVENLVRHQSLDMEVEKLSVASFKEDPFYKSRVEMLEKRIEELQAQPFVQPKLRKREIAKIQKTLSKLRGIFKKHYVEKGKKFECVCELLVNDSEYLNFLKKNEARLPSDYLSKASGMKPSPLAASQLMSSAQTSAALAAASCQDQGKAYKEEEPRKSRRQMSLRRSQTSTSRSSKRNAKDSVRGKQPPVSSKKARYKSVEEVENERKKLAALGRRSLTTELPYLPPTYGTLRALRALLLNRQELVKTAGALYDVKDYSAAKSQQSQLMVVVSDSKDGEGETSAPIGDGAAADASARGQRKPSFLNTFPEMDVQLDSYLKEIGLEMIEAEWNCSVNRLFPEDSLSSSKTSMDVAAGRQIITPASQCLQYLGSTRLDDLSLQRQTQQPISKKEKNSGYEVTYRLISHFTCHKGVDSKGADSEKGPAADCSSNCAVATTKPLALQPENFKRGDLLPIPKSDRSSHSLRVQENSSHQAQSPTKPTDGLVSEKTDASPLGNGKSAERARVMIGDKEGKKDAGDGRMPPPPPPPPAPPVFSQVLQKALPKMGDKDKVVVVGLDPKTKKVVHYASSPGSDVFKPVQEKKSSPKKGNLIGQDVNGTTISLKEMPNNAAAVVGGEPVLQAGKHKATNPAPVLPPPSKNAKLDPRFIEALRQTDQYRHFSSRSSKERKSGWKFLSKTVRAERQRQCRRRWRAKQQIRKEKAALGIPQEDDKDLHPSNLGTRRKGGATRANKAPKQIPAPRRPPLPVVEPRPRRPLRKARVRQEARRALLAEPLPLSQVQGLPVWWKEAVLETMVVRQRVELGQVSLDVRRLSEDEDFRDKGDYSDDDGWLASVLEGEQQEREKMQRLRLEQSEVEEEEGEEGKGREEVAVVGEKEDGETIGKGEEGKGGEEVAVVGEKGDGETIGKGEEGKGGEKAVEEGGEEEDKDEEEKRKEREKELDGEEEEVEEAGEEEQEEQEKELEEESMGEEVEKVEEIGDEELREQEEELEEEIMEEGEEEKNQYEKELDLESMEEEEEEEEEEVKDIGGKEQKERKDDEEGMEEEEERVEEILEEWEEQDEFDEESLGEEEEEEVEEIGEKERKE